MIPHNDNLTETTAEFMSIKYDLDATTGISFNYPGSGSGTGATPERIFGTGLESLSQHISLDAHEPGKYKVLIYMREGGVMRDVGPTPLGVGGARSTGNLEVSLRTVMFGNETYSCRT